MSIEQCWALRTDRARCAEASLPGSFFCERHGRGRGPHPVDIYCLPEREMPPGLVAAIRFRFPDWPLPAPMPAILTLGAPKRPPEPAAASHPVPPPAAATPLPPGRKSSADHSSSPGAPVVARLSASEPEGSSPDWLLALLKAAMEGVMGGDGTPLQKANAVSRLGNLYLKASGVAELRRTNRELARRLAALEERLAVTEPMAEAAAPPTVRSVPRSQPRPSPRAGRRDPAASGAPALSDYVPEDPEPSRGFDTEPRRASLTAVGPPPAALPHDPLRSKRGRISN